MPISFKYLNEREARESVSSVHRVLVVAFLLIEVAPDAVFLSSKTIRKNLLSQTSSESQSIINGFSESDSEDWGWWYCSNSLSSSSVVSFCVMTS
jgi:hypothetical protein